MPPGRLPREVFMSHQEEAPGKTQDTLEGLCFSAGLGTPRGPPRRAGGRVRGKESLGVPAQTAASATRPRISRRKWNGIYRYFDIFAHSVLIYPGQFCKRNVPGVSNLILTISKIQKICLKTTEHKENVTLLTPDLHD
ncbi:hypothetical protein NL108_016284 [Boleophthalmus pectinirostris]|nr:hypothetical protein NL108_016284 [Boleophthalmus pectinirostris]